MIDQLPKVLAFPGWATNANIMQIQMGKLHNILSKYVQIEYLDPSFPVSKEELPQDLQQFIPQNQSLYRWGDQFLNFDSDLTRIINKIKNESNIVGLIGFSQGTYMETLIGHIAMNDLELRQKLKFIICFSGNGIKPLKQYYDSIKLIQIPSFHTIGTKDWLQTESIMQTALFDNPLVIEVPETHRIPRLNQQQQQQLIQFIINNLSKPKL